VRAARCVGSFVLIARLEGGLGWESDLHVIQAQDASFDVAPIAATVAQASRLANVGCGATGLNSTVGDRRFLEVIVKTRGTGCPRGVARPILNR